MSKTISIVTWNVNSIKSRLNLFQDFVEQESPDVLLLQEIKCTNDNFPYLEIEQMGYNIAVHGQKTYNGVAIISKFPIEDVVCGLPTFDDDEQARYIEGVIVAGSEAVRVASVYVPNGKSPDSDKFQYKMDFFDRLRSHTAELLDLEEKLVVGGDYNVAPEPMDVYDPKSLANSICFHPDEQAKLRTILNQGFLDAFRALHQKKQQFSWWDYRGGSYQHDKGMRIDHLLLSPQAADELHECSILSHTRGWEKPSDHAPVQCRIAYND
ncbi:MAG: exodeoxyribonuclease III [Rickettsiales bacterium]|nr:exodeoxyribonuclease III [Rickettsiales bacterium]